MSRVSAVLAVVALVVFLALPCFAADEPTEEQLLDIILDQQDYLNVLYGEQIIDASTYLFQNGFTYSDVGQYVVIDTSAYNANVLNSVPFFYQLARGQSNYSIDSELFYVPHLSVSFYSINDVNELFSVDADVYSVSVGASNLIQNDTTFYFDFYISLIDVNGSQLLELIYTVSATLDMETQSVSTSYTPMIAKGFYNDSLTEFDLMLYEVRGFFIAGLNSDTIFPPLLGQSFTPSYDLQLNIPEGGGATEEELQQEYQRGYNVGYDDGMQQSSLVDLITAIFRAPMELVDSVLDFNIFGINMAASVRVLITMAIIGVIAVVVWKAVK